MTTWPYLHLFARPADRPLHSPIPISHFGREAATSLPLNCSAKLHSCFVNPVSRRSWSILQSQWDRVLKCCHGSCSQLFHASYLMRTPPVRAGRTFCVLDAWSWLIKTLPLCSLCLWLVRIYPIGIWSNLFSTYIYIYMSKACSITR